MINVRFATSAIYTSWLLLKPLLLRFVACKRRKILYQISSTQNYSIHSLAVHLWPPTSPRTSLTLNKGIPSQTWHRLSISPRYVGHRRAPGPVHHLGEVVALWDATLSGYLKRKDESGLSCWASIIRRFALFLESASESWSSLGHWTRSNYG